MSTGVARFVQCDAPDRTTDDGGEPCRFRGPWHVDLKEARNAAKADGWRRIRRPNGWRYGITTSGITADVCPPCAAFFKDVIKR